MKWINVDFRSGETVGQLLIRTESVVTGNELRRLSAQGGITNPNGDTRRADDLVRPCEVFKVGKRRTIFVA